MFAWKLEGSEISLALTFLVCDEKEHFFLQVSASPLWEVLKAGGESGLNVTLMRFGGFLVIWPSALHHPITSLYVGLGALAFPLSVSAVRVFLWSTWSERGFCFLHSTQLQLHVVVVMSLIQSLRWAVAEPVPVSRHRTALPQLQGPFPNFCYSSSLPIAAEASRTEQELKCQIQSSQSQCLRWLDSLLCYLLNW